MEFQPSKGWIKIYADAGRKSGAIGYMRDNRLNVIIANNKGPRDLFHPTDREFGCIEVIRMIIQKSIQ